MAGLEVREYSLVDFSRSETVIALPVGVAGNETMYLNIDSLWTGGPFMYDVSVLVTD
jgi:hypothetical protein